MSIRTRITIKRFMIGMKGILKVVVAKIKDTIVDLKDEAMVLEEVIFLTEHAIHADLLATIGTNFLKILHVLFVGRTIAMKSAWTYMSI